MRYDFWRRRKEDPTLQAPTDGRKKVKKKKAVWREWLDAGLFAIVAATLIRTFLIEAYTIPSGSMEGSLLINDFLFVTKMAYGPRMPMTPISVPLVHNELPLIGGKSFTDAVQWKYRRWPGFSHIHRYDVVVFNFPAGDTVALTKDNYYDEVRNYGREYVYNTYKVITRPVDKEDNYIKRCVALPGDVIELRDGVLFVNNERSPDFPHSKTTYTIQNTNPNGISGISDYLQEIKAQQLDANQFFLERDQYDEIKKMPGVSITPYFNPKGNLTLYGNFDAAFPVDTAHFRWNRDNYGPLTIPKKGVTVPISPDNIALYRRVIRNYEGNKLEENNGTILINGQLASSYTFKMDYYWMMGDNRHNSADSRYFGFVPEDHIVGKAWFVWFSYGDKGIRWGRLLRGIKTLEQ